MVTVGMALEQWQHIQVLLSKSDSPHSRAAAMMIERHTFNKAKVVPHAPAYISDATSSGNGPDLQEEQSDPKDGNL